MQYEEENFFLAYQTLRHREHSVYPFLLAAQAEISLHPLRTNFLIVTK